MTHKFKAGDRAVVKIVGMEEYNSSLVHTSYAVIGLSPSNYKIWVPTNLLEPLEQSATDELAEARQAVVDAALAWFESSYSFKAEQVLIGTTRDLSRLVKAKNPVKLLKELALSPGRQ